MAPGRGADGPGRSGQPGRSFHRFFLAGSVCLTLLLAPLVLGNLHPWGTRGALATVQWLVFCPPRWLCLALALGSGLRTRRFDWISTWPARRLLVVAGAHAGMGLASFFCLVAMSETAPPVPVWLRALAVLTSLVVPGVVTAFLAVPGRAAAPWRSLLVAGLLIDGAAGATIGWREHLDTLEVQRAQVTQKAQQDAQEQIVLAELDDLPKDAPLERWLPFTRVAGMPMVAARAEEIIYARPDLMQELSAALRSADYRTRMLALGFVHDGLTPPLPEGLIPPVCLALSATAVSMRAQVQAHFDLRADEFYPACLLAVDLPDRFPGRAADFVGPIREMRAVFDQMPKGGAPPGQQLLDDWLRRHDPPGPR